MKQTFKIILLFTVLSIVAIGVYLYNMSVNSPYRISSDEAKKRIAAHEIDLVLDVRTEQERNTLGYYPKAIWVPAANLEKEIPPRFPDRNMRMLIYCNTGHRARLATDKLRSLGYSQVFYITSGWKSLV